MRRDSERPPSWEADRSRVEAALRRWRSGEEEVRALADSRLRAAYDRAVELAVRDLSPARSMASLLRLDDEHGGEVDLCIRAACLCAAPHGRMLPSVVRGAAFWRRLRSLLEAWPSGR
jgi:hypothetical protein